MDVSELRHARERLGLSLRDIADRTKIRPAILGAIENDDIDRLPPPIFTRAFVRAFAREVGLDPDAFAEAPSVPRPAAAASGKALSGDGTFEDRSDQYNLTERESSSLVTAAIVIVAGLLFVLIDPWKASPPAPGATSPVAADATGSHGTSGAEAVATTGAAGEQRTNMRVELRPQGPCWIEVTADGTRLIYKLLDAGDRYAIEGYDDLVLKVGDPGALDFTINEAEGRQLGPAGQPTTVHITRENSREFLVGS